MAVQFFMLAGICGVLAAAAAIDERLRNRYRPLEDHADAGLGAEEYRGPRRFTRPTDRTTPVHPAKNVTEVADQHTNRSTRS